VDSFTLRLARLSIVAHQELLLFWVMHNNMTIKEAIEIVSQATEPMAYGKITRSGYVQIEEAIKTIQQNADKLERLLLDKLNSAGEQR
jgi:hypothetical protein